VTTYLNISALARRTGVAPDTLRKWERRYGVLEPERTPGSQRRYSERDVARVEWLRDRLAEGWRIGEAARVLREQAAPALENADDLRRALVQAAENGATTTVDGLLGQAFAIMAPERALADVIAPALVEIGEAWHEGRLSVADEHAVSARIRSRLDQLLADDRPAVRGSAVLACAPGEHHELGLMMLAVALRADGWRVEYLGAATPVPDALAFAERVDAAVVCLSASREQTAKALATALRKTSGRAHRPIVIGGAATDAALARSLGVAHAPRDTAAAVARLRKHART
jgi:MerR family transcriptional regulator, light-induced transcriptional regulator